MYKVDVEVQEVPEAKTIEIGPDGEVIEMDVLFTARLTLPSTVNLLCATDGSKDEEGNTRILVQRFVQSESGDVIQKLPAQEEDFAIVKAILLDLETNLTKKTVGTEFEKA